MYINIYIYVYIGLLHHGTPPPTFSSNFAEIGSPAKGRQSAKKDMLAKAGFQTGGTKAGHFFDRPHGPSGELLRTTSRHPPRPTAMCLCVAGCVPLCGCVPVCGCVSVCVCCASLLFCCVVCSFVLCFCSGAGYLKKPRPSDLEEHHFLVPFLPPPQCRAMCFAASL